MSDKIRIGVEIGAVSSALLSWVEKESGVPIVNLLYYWLRTPNENLEPYIFYLRRAKQKLPAPSNFH